MTSIWNELLGREFRQNFYDAGGRRTRVIEAGKGEPLIFLHGTGGHAEAYIRNIYPHADYYHVYCMDMIGHGYSARPNSAYGIMDFVDHVKDFLDAIGAEKAVISGESLGASVGAWLAITYPERVKKLVLNTGMPAQLPESGRRQIRDVLERSKAAAANLTPEIVRKRLEWLMLDPAMVTDELVDNRYRIYAQPGMASVMEAVAKSILGGVIDDEWSDKWFNSDVLRDVRCPTLVIWTRHNPGQPVESAIEGSKKLSDSRMVILENSAHWPQWEEADAFNRAHLEFLRE